MMKHVSLYLVFTCFNTDVVSGFTLLFHDWTDLQSISLDFFCRKGLLLTNKIHGCLHILVVFGHERRQGNQKDTRAPQDHPKDTLSLSYGQTPPKCGASHGFFLCKWEYFPTHRIKEDRFQVSPSMQQQRKILNHIGIKASEYQISK